MLRGTFFIYQKVQKETFHSTCYPQYILYNIAGVTYLRTAFAYNKIQAKYMEIFNFEDSKTYTSEDLNFFSNTYTIITRIRIRIRH